MTDCLLHVPFGYYFPVNQSICQRRIAFCWMHSRRPCPAVQHHHSADVKPGPAAPSQSPKKDQDSKTCHSVWRARTGRPGLLVIIHYVTWVTLVLIIFPDYHVTCFFYFCASTPRNCLGSSMFEYQMSAIGMRNIQPIYASSCQDRDGVFFFDRPTATFQFPRSDAGSVVGTMASFRPSSARYELISIKAGAR